MSQYFKSYCLEVTKTMKLDAVEYTLLMWLFNVSHVYEVVTLNFTQIQNRLPFVIKRSQFERAVNKLIDVGFIYKNSDKHNVSYLVNESMLNELVNNNGDFTAANDAADAAGDLGEENKKPAEPEAEPVSVLRDQKRRLTDIIESDAEKVNTAAEPLPPQSTDLIQLPAEPLPKKAKRSVFVIPEIREIADHMYNYLSQKGIANLDAKKIELEAERFFYYYNSNSWRVGKKPMTNWRSAASGWLCRNDNLNKFCVTGAYYDNSLEQFQKLVNPDGFKFYK